MSLAYDILGMIDDKSLKSQDIHSKLVSFNSIHLTLQANNKNMCLSLKNNHSFSKKRRFSCSRLPNRRGNFGYDRDNSLKPQDVPSKLVAFYSFCLTLEVNHINVYLSLKNNLLYRKNFAFRASRLQNRMNIKNFYITR